jgi:hypothetical protein
MASVFLSYDRDDAAKARPLALALEKAGHSVWWDLHIRGGAQYAKVIDEALKAADAVVVLWSRQSVESAWVRDEAAAGRDNGRLVPALLDGTQPPLGFRQFQNVDLTRWKGRGQPKLRELFEAIEGVTGNSPVQAPTATTTRTRRASRFALHWLIPAILVLVLVAAGAFVAWRLLEPRSSSQVVAVEPADPSAQSQALARDLLVKLGRLQSAAADTMELTQKESGRVSDFTFQVSASNAGSKSQASIALVARNGVLLWSKDIEGPAEQLSDLKQQMAVAAARALGCVNEATASGSKLDQQTLKLYVTGCVDLDALFGTSIGDLRSVIPIFSEVTRRAPEFKGAWAKLLLSETEVATKSLLSERRSTEEALRRHLAIARKLDPRLPEVLQTEIRLLPLTAVSRRMELIDKAVALHPDHAGLRDLRSTLLMGVGRMHSAVQDAKLAAETDILSPAMRMSHIFALAHSGQREVAQHELAKADILWPGVPTLNDVRFSIDLRYGDPESALKQLKTGSFQSDIPASQESFLRARINPTTANVDRAILEAAATKRQTMRQFIQVLAEFGRNDAAINELLTYEVNTREQFTDVLFRPNTRKLRQDRRFMQVAKRFGLLGYWQESGKWPDFCFEPDLPYNCKAEAAKLK